MGWGANSHFKAGKWERIMDFPRKDKSHFMDLMEGGRGGERERERERERIGM